MMTVRKPFDRFNKSLFRELLSPFGEVVPNMAVLGEERMIDVFFVPNPEVELDVDGLGDLASLVTQPALLEPFRSALTDDNVKLSDEAVHGVRRDEAIGLHDRRHGST